VVVTGVGAISPLGHDWPTVYAALRGLRNAVQYMTAWDEIEGLNTRLGVPALPFTLPDHYNRKATRSMGRVALMATRQRAGAGRCRPAGRPARGQRPHGHLLWLLGRFAAGHRRLRPHDVREEHRRHHRQHLHQDDVAHGGGEHRRVPRPQGRIVTTSSACAAGSQGIGYAFEAIQSGKQVAMLAGGAEELDPIDAAVFDTLFATSVRNDEPPLTPRPFDAKRDGLVLGEGACTLVLEELEHAKARGARILAEVAGYGTNSDGTHVTQPHPPTMAQAMRLGLESAGHSRFRDRLRQRPRHRHRPRRRRRERGHLAVLGDQVPISSLKSYMGHTLGACGALEAWMTIEMMREGWFAPNLNLENVDPDCAPLDYVRGGGRELQTEWAMSNNFAFGGINTSLVLRRWQEAILAGAAAKNWTVAQQADGNLQATLKVRGKHTVMVLITYTPVKVLADVPGQHRHELRPAQRRARHPPLLQHLGG
jgi:3-oxoacyl-[acyl-carrier-protein] synthase II